MTQALVDQAVWVQLSDKVWKLQSGFAMLSAVILKEGWWIVLCAGFECGRFNTAKEAKKAAEDYWLAQDVGGLV